MKPFARVAQDLDDDPDIASLPSDAARYAWVLTILCGKKVGGRWESRNHWAAAVGRNRMRHLQSLIDAGLLQEFATGTIRAKPEAWRRWQVDPTGIDRQRKHRADIRGETA